MSLPSEATVGLTLLREFVLSIDGVPVMIPMATQRVVAFLAFHDRAVLRSHVAASLWLDVSDTCAHGSLRSALWRLGSAGPAIILTSNGSLRLDPYVAVDLRHSINIAQGAMSTSSAWAPTQADVLSLSADLLPGWCEDWVLIERERFRQLRMHALEAVCLRLTAEKNFGSAIQAGLAAVSSEPLRESAQRVLIRAYLAEGNAGEANRQYRAFRQLLREELDLEPSIEMQRLVQDIHP